MANDFSANYLIGISLTNLEALKSLRAELLALREDSKQPIDFAVNVKPNTADNIAVAVESKVSAALEKAAAKGRGKAKAVAAEPTPAAAAPAKGRASASGKDTVAMDATALAKLDKLTTAIDALAGTMKRPPEKVEATVDAQAIKQAVADGVAEGLSRAPQGAGGNARSSRDLTRGRATRTPLTAELREGFTAEAEGLGDVTLPATAKETSFKQTHKKLLNAARYMGEDWRARMKAFSDEVKEAEGAVGVRQKAFDGGATLAEDPAQIHERMAALVKTQDALLQEARTGIAKRFDHVTKTLARGFEVTRNPSANMSDLNAQLKTSTLQLEKAFATVGAHIADQLKLFTETLVERLGSLTVNVGTMALDPDVAKAYEDAGMVAPGAPTKAGRSLKRAPKRRADQSVPLPPGSARDYSGGATGVAGAFVDTKGREFFPNPSGLAPATGPRSEIGERLAASGRGNLESWLAAQAKKAKQAAEREANRSTTYETMSAKLKALPASEFQGVVAAARLYSRKGLFKPEQPGTVYFGPELAEGLRQKLGVSLGERAEDGSMRVHDRRADATAKVLGKVLKTFKGVDPTNATSVIDPTQMKAYQALFAENTAARPAGMRAIERLIAPFGAPARPDRWEDSLLPGLDEKYGLSAHERVGLSTLRQRIRPVRNGPAAVALQYAEARKAAAEERAKREPQVLPFLPDPSSITPENIGGILGNFGLAREALLERSKLAAYARNASRMPEGSPLQTQAMAEMLRTQALQLPTSRPLLDGEGQVRAQATLAGYDRQVAMPGPVVPIELRAKHRGDILARYKSGTVNPQEEAMQQIAAWEAEQQKGFENAKQFGFQFTPYGEREQVLLAAAMRSRGQRTVRRGETRRDEWSSESNDRGGEWHLGPFKGFRSSLVRPELQGDGDYARGSASPGLSSTSDTLERAYADNQRHDTPYALGLPNAASQTHRSDALTTRRNELRDLELAKGQDAQRLARQEAAIVALKGELTTLQAKLAEHGTIPDASPAYTKWQGQQRALELERQVNRREATQALGPAPDYHDSEAYRTWESRRSMIQRNFVAAKPKGPVPDEGGGREAWRQQRSSLEGDVALLTKQLAAATENADLLRRSVHSDAADKAIAAKQAEVRHAEAAALAASIPQPTSAAGSATETATAALGGIRLAGAQFARGRHNAYASVGSAAGAPAAPPAAGGGGGNGNGVTPPPTTGGFAGGSGGPGDWNQFAGVVKSLDNVRLTGLATDFKEMAAAMAMMKSLPASQWAALVAVSKSAHYKARAEADTASVDSKTRRLDQRDAQIQNTRAWLELQGQWGAKRAGGALGAAVGGVPSAFPGDELSMGALADRFLKLNTKAGRKALDIDELLNTYGRSGRSDATIGRKLESNSLSLDATRQTAMDTIMAAAGRNSTLAGLHPQIQAYAAESVQRRVAQDELGQFGMQGPQMAPAHRLAAETSLISKINQHREAENKLSKEILNTASAQFKATAELQKHGTIVDQVVNKTKSLALYATGGMIAYQAFGAIRSAFSQSVSLESDMAHMQGLVGNHTVAERNRLEKGVLSAAVDYGVPLSSVVQTAKTFAQTGIGVDRTASQTRAALSGQLGAGLEGQQSTEMLIAVDNITKSVVGATDILDRISSIESKYAVTAQDLSVAIQRVGSLATQLQPTRVGRTDALDFVIGATSTQVGETRVNGGQSANALKFMLARLSSPEVMKQLQGTYGVKLAANADGTQLRPLIDIFGDIAKTYKQLLKQEENGSSKSGVAAQFLQVVAGQRQTNQAAALFGNWDKVMKTAEESSKAWGDTQRRVELQMDTFAFQVERTKNAFVAFTSELLKQSGALGLVKGLASGAGTLANVGRVFPGGAAVAGGAALYGIGKGAALLSQLPKFAAAGEAAGGAVVGQTLANNTGSLLRLIAALATKLGTTGLIVGGVTAAMVGGGVLINKIRNRNKGPFDNPDIDPDKLRESELYQNYDAMAQRNGVSANRLQELVAGAARDARTKVLEDPKFKKAGPNLFTTDDDKRKYMVGVADATEREFVDAVSKAVPEIGKIADASEKASAALMLLKQSSQVSQMTSSYVAAYQDENLTGYTKEMQGKLQDAFKSGAFAFKALELNGRPQIASATQGHVENVLGHMFGAFGGTLTGAQVNGSAISAQITNRMQASLAKGADKAESMGQAFDAVMTSALELNDAQQKTVRAYLTKHPEVAAKSEFAQRDALIAGLSGGSATERGAAKQLTNAKALDMAFYRELEKSIPLVKNGIAGGYSGGIKGSDLVLESVMRAGRMRTADLRKAGRGADAEVYEQALSTMAAPKNRDAFNMMLMKGTNHIGLVRDRMLEPILRYAVADAAAVQGGEALKRQGISVDVASERNSAAQQLVRGHYEAKAQIMADVLRAASKSAEFKDMASHHMFGGVTENEDGGKLAAARTDIITGVRAGMSPEEKQRLDSTLESARLSAAHLASNKDLFGALGTADQQSVRNILEGGDSAKERILNADALGAIYERLAKTMDERVTAEQLAIQKTQLLGNAQLQLLDLTQEEARSRRGIQLRRAEFTSGGAVVAGLKVADVNAVYHEQMRRAQLEFNNTMAEVAKLKELHSGDYETKVEAAKATLEAAGRAAAGTRNRGVTELTAAEGQRLDQRELDFRLRRGEVADGAYGRYRAHASMLNGEKLEDARREYLLSIEQKKKAQGEGMVQSATSGVRSTFVSYDTTKGRDLGGRLARPLLDTMSGKTVDAFLSNLVGPDGVFGKSLGKLFNAQIFAEADVIKAAHIDGITEGFARAESTNGPTLQLGAMPDLATTSGKQYAAALRAHAAGIAPPLGSSSFALSTTPRLDAATAIRAVGAGTAPEISKVLGIGATLGAVAVRSMTSNNALAGALTISGAGSPPPIVTAVAEAAAKVAAKTVKPTATAYGVFAAGEKLLGTPFTMGSINKQVALDCSAFVREVFSQQGLKLPRTSAELGSVGRPVKDLKHARAGDIMLFEDDKLDGTPHHAAIYAGGGRILHESSSGKSVRYDSLNSEYGKGLMTYLLKIRRVLPDDALGGDQSFYRATGYVPRTGGMSNPFFGDTLGPSRFGNPYALHAFAGARYGYVKTAMEAALTSPLSLSATPNMLAPEGVYAHTPAGIGGAPPLHGPRPEWDTAPISYGVANWFEDSWRKKAKAKLGELGAQGALIAGNLLGGRLGSQAGVNNRNNYGSEGAQLGSSIGALIGSAGGPLGTAIGGFAGGLLGGLLGGRKGKEALPPEFQALEKIDRNTRETVSAIENQTHGLLALENRLLSVPASFRIPQYAVASGGGTAGDPFQPSGSYNITVNVNGATDPRSTSQAVMDQMRAELRGAGSFVSPRGGRN